MHFRRGITSRCAPWLSFRYSLSSATKNSVQYMTNVLYFSGVIEIGRPRTGSCNQVLTFRSLRSSDFAFGVRGTMSYDSDSVSGELSCATVFANVETVGRIGVVFVRSLVRCRNP